MTKAYRSCLLLGLAGCLAAWAGCGRDRDRVEYYEDGDYYEDNDDGDRTVIIREEPVVIHETHVHSPDCGHYYDGARWYQAPSGHRHGPGCGHDYDGRYWVTRRPVEHKHLARDNRPPPPRKHVHSANCGCVYDRGRWVRVRGGHHHGPDCGHIYRDGRWSTRR